MLGPRRIIRERKSCSRWMLNREGKGDDDKGEQKEAM
jgi:hypothetical protein